MAARISFLSDFDCRAGTRRSSTLKHVVLGVVLVLAAGFFAALGWYSLFYDEGVRLGQRLAREAQSLRESHESERVFSYRPLLGAHQEFSVGIGAGSQCAPEQGRFCGDSGLTVRVERGNSGSTTYFRRFVSVPKALYIAKNGSDLVVALRKTGGNVEVVALR